MSTPLRFVFLVATLAQLSVILALWLVPVDYLGAYLVPEVALRHTRIFTGPQFLYDEINPHFVPPPIYAWRRLIVARDTAAFRRIAQSGSAAGQLYAILGLRALNAHAGTSPHRSPSDSIEINMRCREIQLDVLSAAHVVLTSVQPTDLLKDPLICL